MFGYIYRTFNVINGRFYIGQHHGEFSVRYKGSGQILRKAFRKYGWENFIVDMVCPCEDQIDLDLCEQNIIRIYREFGFDLYNIADGGRGALGFRHSQKHKEKMRHLMLGKPKSPAHRAKIKNRFISDEYRANNSAAQKGKRYSQDYKDRMRISVLARKLTSDQRLKISLANKGRPRTAWQIESSRIANTGKIVSAETRAKQGAWQIGRKLPAAHIANRARSLRLNNAIRRGFVYFISLGRTQGVSL